MAGLPTRIQKVLDFNQALSTGGFGAAARANKALSETEVPKSSRPAPGDDSDSLASGAKEEKFLADGSPIEFDEDK